jgi:hypothetical protein
MILRPLVRERGRGRTVCEGGDERVIGDFSKKQVGEVAVLARKYGYLDQGDTYDVNIKCSSDYDGTPYEDFCTLQKLDAQQQPLWEITVGYKSTHQEEEEYDYVAPVARSRSTAYKMRGGGEATPQRFKLASVWVQLKGHAQDVVCEDLRNLRSLYSRMDAHEKSLSDWAQSGLDVWVRCTRLSCISPYGERNRILNEKLAEYADHGFSIETLGEKLTCKRCGSRKPALLPAGTA